MSRIIHISLSPNLEADDLQATQALLTTPRVWLHGDAEERLIGELRRFFPQGVIFLFGKGRSALLEILRALQLQKGDEVLTQAFTCLVIPNAISGAGGKPVYVDIEKKGINLDFEDFLQRLSAYSRAVIIQNTFGYPVALREILQVAKANNLYVIEDLAHALGAKYTDRYLGTFGDAAILSFGREKVISSVFGGALVVNNPELAARIQARYRELVYPSKKWILQQLLHPLITSYALHHYEGVGKYCLELTKRLHIISLEVTNREREGLPSTSFRLPNALAELALRQLKKLERFNEHRRRIAGIYRDQLGDFRELGVSSPHSLDEAKMEPVYLRYPLLVDHPAALLSAAKKQRVILGDWYKEAVMPRPREWEQVGYTPGSCPSAEAVSKRIVNLPTHIKVSEEDAMSICEIVTLGMRRQV